MSITSRINEMSSHIDQAYDELQGLGADLTNVNKNIENISMVLDDIYDSLPSVSGEGTSLTLDDTRVGKIKSTLKGNTSQTTYSGKNLLGLPNGTNTSGGLTITRNNGLITFTGTASVTYPNTGNVPYTLGTGTYTISSTNNTYDFYLWFRNSSNETIYTANLSKSTKTITITTNDIASVVIGVEHLTPGTSYNLSTSIQIESGNSATSYEPYVGGTASPNPSYPQPINVVSGDNEIVVNGKNFLKLNDIAETTKNGMTYSCKDGVLTLNGTATSGIIIDFDNVFLPAGTYYISRNSTGTTSGSWQNYLRNSSGSVRQGEGSFTTTEGQYVYFRLYMNSGVVFTNYTFKPMVNLGSTGINFEPYQGNNYNIDLPVENLFDKSTAVLNKMITGSGGLIDFTGVFSSDYIKVQPSTAYYVNEYMPTVVAFDENKNAIGYIRNASGSATFTTPNNCEYIRARMFDASIDMTTALNNAMLEKGTKGNSYTPYGTTPIELCKIGNYQDYFYKDSGKWYLHKEIGKVVLNGSENIARESIQNNHYKFYLQNISNVDYGDINYIPKILCDKLIAIRRTTMYVNTQGISSSNGALQIYTDDTKDMTISEFRTWLGSNNLIVYYGLITPTTTEITYQPLIDQLNLLEKAMSYNGQTNISQVNNDLPFIISASALKEWQESASLNNTLSMVNPLSLGNTLNTQENDIQPIEVDNIEPLEEEENEES